MWIVNDGLNVFNKIMMFASTSSAQAIVLLRSMFSRWYFQTYKNSAFFVKEKIYLFLKDVGCKCEYNVFMIRRGNKIRRLLLLQIGFTSKITFIILSQRPPQNDVDIKWETIISCSRK